ncbi:MAG: LysR substrate-binding domain-containing protein, partial [Pseudomonadota bacterium]
KTFHLPVSGSLTFNDSSAKINASKQHLGLSYEVQSVVQKDIDNGELVCVLEDYLPTIPGFHIYFSSRSQMMLKLRAFIDSAKSRLL